MSTYLIAFVISDFDYKSNIRDGDIIYPREYRIYAKPNAPKESMDYSLDIGQRSFQFMQTYMDISYRLPKLDNVALPDFLFGAMENWGLITYRYIYRIIL
jgi:aminopeptidase N